MRRENRIFFALWPDESLRQQIESAPFPKLKASTTPRDNWHITLVFLGASTPLEQTRFNHAAGNISVDPFEIVLDTIGQFSHARVAWLGCRHCPEALLNFQQQLETALRRVSPDHASFAKPVRAFTPHITLYRHVERPDIETSLPSIRWKVNKFSLLESQRDRLPVYRKLKTWRF